MNFMWLKRLEIPGIDPGTSHMLSERSTTWANSPVVVSVVCIIVKFW